MAHVYKSWPGLWGAVDSGDPQLVASRGADVLHLQELNQGENQANISLNALWRNRTPLFLAVQRKDLQCVEVLLALGADANVACLRRNVNVRRTGIVVNNTTEGENDSDETLHDYGVSALYAAILHVELEIAELLLEHGANPDRLNGKQGISALHLATSKGLIHACNLLLRFGAAVDIPSPVYGTPLSVAVAKGHRFIARLLLEAGAAINARSPHSDESVLHTAARLGDAETTKTLLATAGDRLNAAAKDSDGNTALHLAVFSAGWHRPTGHGRALWGRSAVCGEGEVVALMLAQRYPDLAYARNSEGHRALYYAESSLRTDLKHCFSRPQFSGFADLLSNSALRRRTADVNLVFGKKNGDSCAVHSAVIKHRAPELWQLSKGSCSGDGMVQILIRAKPAVASALVYFLYADGLNTSSPRMTSAIADLRELQELGRSFKLERLVRLCERAIRQGGDENSSLVMDEEDWMPTIVDAAADSPHAQFFAAMAVSMADGALHDLCLCVSSEDNSDGNCEKAHIYCNQAILCRHEYFRALLVTHSLSSDGHNTSNRSQGACDAGAVPGGMRHVRLDDVTFAAAQGLIEYSYTWHCRSFGDVMGAADSADSIVELFEASNRACIDGLRHSCEEILAARVLSPENVCYLLQLGDAYQTLFLREECFEFACTHFDLICGTQQFQTLPRHLREELAVAQTRRGGTRRQLLDSSETVQSSRARPRQLQLSHSTYSG